MESDGQTSWDNGIQEMELWPHTVYTLRDEMTTVLLQPSKIHKI